jgi:hypothetical protein
VPPLLEALFYLGAAPVLGWQWQVLVLDALLTLRGGCKLLPRRYNGAVCCKADVVMVALPVPPQRLTVNPVRPGREQPQR